ncbi:hypothetical protein SLA2020_453190 [Shorea laevis]
MSVPASTFAAKALNGAAAIRTRFGSGLGLGLSTNGAEDRVCWGRKTGVAGLVRSWRHRFGSVRGVADLKRTKE